MLRPSRQANGLMEPLTPTPIPGQSSSLSLEGGVLRLPFPTSFQAASVALNFLKASSCQTLSPKAESCSQK